MQKTFLLIVQVLM